jgi:hypothetical protein
MKSSIDPRDVRLEDVQHVQKQTRSREWAMFFLAPSGLEVLGGEESLTNEGSQLRAGIDICTLHLHHTDQPLVSPLQTPV